MRIRWGRIGAALGALAGLPVGFVGVLWLTGPTPAQVPRQTPGPRACRANDVLVEAVTARPELGAPWDHAEMEDPPASWQAAADTLLAAAACDAIGDLASEPTFPVYNLTARGIAWLAHRGDGGGDGGGGDGGGVDDLVTAWELTADQSRNGSVIGLAVATAHQRRLYEALDARIASLGPAAVPDDERARATDRLRAIADHGVDWAHAYAVDERAIWSLGTRAFWHEPLGTLRAILADRSGRCVFHDDLDEDAALARLDALLLASALDDRGCAQPEPDHRDLHMGIDRRRCVAYGAVGDRIHLASLAR